MREQLVKSLLSQHVSDEVGIFLNAPQMSLVSHRVVVLQKLIVQREHGLPVLQLVPVVVIPQISGKLLGKLALRPQVGHQLAQLADR